MKGAIALGLVACAALSGCALPDNQMGRLDSVGGWNGEAAPDGSRGMYKNGLSTHSIHFIQTVEKYPVVVIHAISTILPKDEIVVDGVSYPAIMAQQKRKGRGTEYKLVSISKQDFKGIADAFYNNRQVNVNGVSYDTGDFGKALQTFLRADSGAAVSAREFAETTTKVFK